MVFLLSLVLFTQISVYTSCDIGTVHLVSHECSKNYITEANLTMKLISALRLLNYLYLSTHCLVNHLRPDVNFYNFKLWWDDASHPHIQDIWSKVNLKLFWWDLITPQKYLHWSTGQGSISSGFMWQSDMHNSVDLVFLETVHVYHLVNLPCSPQIHEVVQSNLNKKTIFSRVAEKWSSCPANWLHATACTCNLRLLLCTR